MIIFFYFGGENNEFYHLLKDYRQRIAKTLLREFPQLGNINSNQNLQKDIIYWKSRFPEY